MQLIWKYRFQERHKLSNISAKNIDDTKEFFNAFETTGKYHLFALG